MNDETFRAVLDWFMCSDPWPVENDSGHNIVYAWLESESKERSFSGWVEAYHLHAVSADAGEVGK